MSRAADTAASFDVAGPLPEGVAVLEASAGTGKTFTIAALATRFVAEGAATLDELLVVTFTRMATGELRERVRDRMTSAERALAGALRGTPVPPGDVVAVHLADAPDDEVERRRARLAAAIADFDAATITTIHGFCQEALSGLGFVGEVERGCAFTEDVGDLVDQVAGDLYVRRFHRPHGDDPDGEWPPIAWDQARAIAKAAIATPGAELVPTRDDPDPVAAMRVRLAEAARDELERRKRAGSVMTFDDLLVRLDRALRGDGGAQVADRLRGRFRVVLVDEFQDTDPVQWSIMRRAFAADGCRLVLIGDPKQAIYAFRGADVHAYLEASETARTHGTLTTNHRSDGPLLEALERVFGRARLGHERIVFRPVAAADHHREPRLVGAPGAAPLQVRLLDRTTSKTRGKTATLDPARDAVAEDLARQVVALLASRAHITQPDGTAEQVRPGDVAVLVRRNADATRVQTALQRVGVPAVVGGAGSVFATASARHWLALLDALEQPGSPTRARAVALSPFLDRTPEQVASADDDDWGPVHDRLHAWAAVLRDHGISALLARATAEERVAERLLSGPDGERELTDLRHIGQQLHVVATAERLGVAALAGWLRRRMDDAEDDAAEDRTRRLESDAEAVQVLTIHRSKGLEFPIVLCPYLWHPSYIDPKVHPIAFHDPDDGHVRKLDVGCDPVVSATAIAREVSEVRGEDLRLAYVALTRARHRAMIWWAGSADSKRSPLHRLVFAQGANGAIPDEGDGVPSDEEAVARFRELAADRPGLIDVEVFAAGSDPVPWDGDAKDAGTLDSARFERAIDRDWGRTSFSAIVDGSRDLPRVASEPEDDGIDDEPTEDVGPSGPESAATPGSGATPGSAAVATAGSTAAAKSTAAAEPTAAAESTAARPTTESTMGSAVESHPDGPGVRGPAGEDLLDAPSPMADLPAGRHFGTLVHDVLEAADYAADDLDAELRGHVLDAIARRRLDVGDPERLVAALRGVLETPLGPTVGNTTLRDVGPADRLTELTFELPLAGGAHPSGRLRPAAIGALLREHLADGDPLRPYAERLDDDALDAALRGYLTGSIDLVVRTRGADGRARYVVVDHKTNRLGPRDRVATLRDHGPAALADEMRHADYALQGLLYLVALHRYLRWRVADHDPDRDIAGLLYLFVRGMRGADTPTVGGTPTGVFAWRPPGGLLEALSDLFDRGDA